MVREKGRFLVGSVMIPATGSVKLNGTEASFRFEGSSVSISPTTHLGIGVPKLPAVPQDGTEDPSSELQ